VLLAQDDIDAVMKSADAAMAGVSREDAGNGGGPAGGRSAPFEPSPLDQLANASPRVQRILKLRVPLIVQLAGAQIGVSDIMQWGRGTIVEFNKSVDSRLDLLVNNIAIGAGEAVKVGENFGLRVTAIVDFEARARSLNGLST
jgi:flagellar motor switch protein FliN/FliY